jgi:hypothetical protein
MHRIDTPTAQKDKFGAGKNGFTRGNPRQEPRPQILMTIILTCCRKSWLAWWKLRVVLDKSKHNQLLTALKSLLLSRAHPFARQSDGLQWRGLFQTQFCTDANFTGGYSATKKLVIQWGTVTVRQLVSFLRHASGLDLGLAELVRR